MSAPVETTDPRLEVGDDAAEPVDLFRSAREGSISRHSIGGPGGETPLKLSNPFLVEADLFSQGLNRRHRGPPFGAPAGRRVSGVAPGMSTP